jgi:hypothetical protein
MTVSYLNGVRNYYGPRVTEDLYGGAIKTEGHVQQLEYRFQYDNLPVYEANGAAALVIPAYSLIVSAKIFCKVALLTSTAMTVGLVDTVDGSAIDVDGMISAANGAVADMSLGAWVIGTGALIGNTVDMGALDGQVSVATTGSAPTAGDFHLVIEYIQGNL